MTEEAQKKQVFMKIRNEANILFLGLGLEAAAAYAAAIGLTGGLEGAASSSESSLSRSFFLAAVLA